MQVVSTAEIDASAEHVWNTVKHFGGLTRWAPGITECTATGNEVGSMRTIRTKDGMTIKERLQSYDDAAQTFSYTIVEGPIPVENYLSRVTVTPNGDSCTIVWETSGEPAGVPAEVLEKILNSVCKGSVKALKAHCEMQSTAQVKKFNPEGD